MKAVQGFGHAYVVDILAVMPIDWLEHSRDRQRICIAIDSGGHARRELCGTNAEARDAGSHRGTPFDKFTPAGRTH